MRRISDFVLLLNIRRIDASGLLERRLMSIGFNLSLITKAWHCACANAIGELICNISKNIKSSSDPLDNFVQIDHSSAEPKRLVTGLITSHSSPYTFTILFASFDCNVVKKKRVSFIGQSLVVVGCRLKWRRRESEQAIYDACNGAWWWWESFGKNGCHGHEITASTYKSIKITAMEVVAKTLRAKDEEDPL